MRHQKWFLALAAMASLFAASLSVHAQPPNAGNQPVIAVTTERPLAELLPDKLAGVKATGDIKPFNAGNLAELAGDQATVYREYYVTRAAARQYGAARVEVFQSSHPFGAFGLLSFYGGTNSPAPDHIGAGSARTPEALVFWKDRYFVRVTAASGQPHMPVNGDATLARAIANALPTTKLDEHPVVFRSLPTTPRPVSSPRYYLGPETLNTAVAGTRDLYAFNGDAEAVVAEYEQKPDAETERHGDAAIGDAVPAPPRPRAPDSADEAHHHRIPHAAVCL
ncbi:MAG TPA: DUF6599 family protein [Blastocatellia bacterium]|nr:DUF6599 family protein [Blastocatellia bacterium]